MQLGVFWCFFAYYIRAPQTSSFGSYIQPHSGPFLSFLAYYMGGSLRSVYSHRIWGPPQISFFAYYGCLFMSVFFILYGGAGGPSDHFFAYYIGAPRSLSLLTIWGPPDQFLHKIYGGPLRSVSSLTIWGPLRLVSLLTIWGPSDQFLCILFWGPLSDHFFLLLDGAPSDQFLRILYGGPSDQFLRLLYGGPLRSVSSLTI